MRWIDKAEFSNKSHHFKSQFNSGISSPVFSLIFFCLKLRVELYKLSHEKVQKRELMPKKAEQLKFLMRFVEIFNTPRFERIFRETVLKKIDLNRYFYWKKNIENDVFLERTFFFQPCDYVIILVFSKMCSKKFNKKVIVKFFDVLGQSLKFTNYCRRVIHLGHPPSHPGFG